MSRKEDNQRAMISQITHVCAIVAVIGRMVQRNICVDLFSSNWYDRSEEHMCVPL